MSDRDHGGSKNAGGSRRSLPAAAALLLGLAAAGGCARIASTRDAPRYFGYGNDPGWLLTIDRSRIKFTAEPAMRIELPASAPVPISTGRRYRSSELLIDVERRPCHDRKSGLAFRDTVKVTAGRTLFNGCGGPRLPLLDR